MASILSHGVAALGMGTAFYDRNEPKSVWVAGVACSMIPDLDVIGFRFGIHYGDFWGHRGFTHSLAFAAILALAFTVGISLIQSGIQRSRLLVYLILATASHGFLDAMTNGGLGVAFFSPFDNRRFFLPWRPIVVSPIGITRFFTLRSVGVLKNEILWIWVPAVLFMVLVMLLRRSSRAQAILLR